MISMVVSWNFSPKPINWSVHPLFQAMKKPTEAPARNGWSDWRPKPEKHGSGCSNGYMPWNNSRSCSWNVCLKNVAVSQIISNIMCIIIIYIYTYIERDMYIYGLQPKFRLMKSSIGDILIFGNRAGAWKTIIHSSKNSNICLYTKTWNTIIHSSKIDD